DFAALGVEDGDFAVALEGDEARVAFGVLDGDGGDVAMFNGAAVDGLDVVFDQRGGRDAAGVERAHGELRTGLADGLGGDDAGGEALFDDLVGGHVHAVAQGAHAAVGLAGEGGADADGFELEIPQRIRDLVGDELVFLDDILIGDGVSDGVAGSASDDHVLELDFDSLAFVDGGLGDPRDGAAVVLGDD